MKITVQALVLFLISAAAACGGDANHPDGRDDTQQSMDDAGDTVEGDASEPGTLETASGYLNCISAALSGDGEINPSVWRLGVALTGEAATVSLQRGLQFPRHAQPGTLGDVEERMASVVVGETTEIREPGDTGLRVTLTRSGGFFVGSLAGAPCCSQDAVALTCWDDAEVFGEPWAGRPGALGFRYQWNTGKCVDAAGNEGRNDIPVEFVRETGYGECADLRGVRLNGDDLGYPQLRRWFLAGADLSGAELFFASLPWATLNGARLGELQFGYAVVSGSVDGFTQLPNGSSCDVLEDGAGASATCAQ